MEDNQAHFLRIERPLYDQEGLHQALNYHNPQQSLCSHIKYSSCNFGKFLVRSVPILKWLPRYKWREDLISDLVAGFTIAIMQIPQGMAYALLANVPPIIGIYMAFFPVIVYVFLGTSRHNSMGTLAIVCLMIGKVVIEKSNQDQQFSEAFKSNSTDGEPIIIKHAPIEIATALTFIVGIFQLIMYVLRLGIVSALFSDILANALTTGAATTVLISQIKYLFGLNIPKHKGAFSVIKTLVSTFQEITNRNIAATIISTITITICCLYNKFLKDRMSQVSSFPLPIELLMIVLGTLISHQWNFEKVYNITIVGDIPRGLPAPSLPNFSILSSVAFEGLIIAIITYTISLSMALVFAHKLGYKVDANQELLAMGAGNLLGSFFSCMPYSANFSRSLMQQSNGGKTQLTSIVSCFILLCVLLWIGPFFETLPKCVLASIIIVSLKGMLMQLTFLKRYWNLSKLDGVIWMITFSTVVFINIEIGLLVGIIVSLLSLLILGMKPYICLLGSVPNTDLYVDIARYSKAVEIPHIKIFHYCGTINFVTKNYFENKLYRLVGTDPRKVMFHQNKETSEKSENNEQIQDVENNSYSHLYNTDKIHITSVLKFIIIDFSALSYIDPSSVTTIKTIAENFQKIYVRVFIAGSSGPVYDTMKKCKLLTQTNLLTFFPTVHDAVQTAVSIFDVTHF